MRRRDACSGTLGFCRWSQPEPAFRPLNKPSGVVVHQFFPVMNKRRRARPRNQARLVASVEPLGTTDANYSTISATLSSNPESSVSAGLIAAISLGRSGRKLPFASELTAAGAFSIAPCNP